MLIIHRAILCGTSALALSIAAFPAAAQTETQKQTQPQASDGIETVVVTGIRSSLRDSLLMKKNSDLITDNISTKDIGQLPDVTIAEELNRLPGLNTTLDRGNASQAAVRGLGPRLVLGLVNGREVASSEPDQNVRWEIYPSEVVAAVSVYKSQSADLIAGGVAATIDLKTTAPLDYEGPSLTLRAGPEYNEEANDLPHYDPWGVRASGAYITHLNDQLAIAVAASFQREKNGYDSFQGWGYNLANSGTAGDVTGDGIADSTPWGAQSEVTEIQQDRMALSGAVQWRPTDNLEIKADALYSAYTIHEDQYQQWYGDNNNWGDYTYPQNNSWCGGADSWAYDCVGGTTGTPSNLIIQNGVISGGQLDGSYISVTNVIAKYLERHTLAVGGLNAKWHEGDWVVTGDLSHSEAWRNNEWQAILTESYPTSMVFNTSNGTVPYYQTYSDSGATVIDNPADVNAQWMQNYRPSQVSGPEHTMDNLSAAQLDATRALDGSLFTNLSFGLRYAGRKKTHTELAWDECPGAGAISIPAFVAAGYSCGGSGAALGPAGLSNFTVKDYHVPTMLYGDFDQLAASSFNNFSNGFFSPPASGADQLGQHWGVQEDVFEGYARADFAHDIAGIPMTGNIGARVTNVASASTGYLTTDGINFSPSSAKKSYTDVLPSLSMNFHLSDENVLRFGASVAVSRPPLDELRIGNSLSTSAPWTGSEGNPKLNPYRADQVDLDYEWYFHPESLFAAAIYFKHLNSFIGYQTHQELINGNNYTISQAVNGEGGNLTGLELTLQSRFYFLPGFLEDFGVYANYAYVNSGLHEFTPVGNPLEATGLAKHTAEADLWYYRDGFEARLAYKIHSPFTVIAGWNAQTLTRLDWERTLDASLSYQWNENIGLRFQARNLTNEVSRSYWDNNPSELARYDTFGRSYLLDISYRN
jgi:TonB-dependent receptor